MSWTVPGKVVHVISGDSVLVEVDLGWNISLRTNVRVEGISADGLAAKKEAQHLLPPGTRVVVESRRLLPGRDSYVRVLADLLYGPDQRLPTEQGHFGLAMLASGHAKRWPAS